MITHDDLLRMCTELTEVAGETQSFDEQWASFGIDPDDAYFVLTAIVDYPGDELRNELEQKVSFAFSLGLKIGQEQSDGAS